MTNRICTPVKRVKKRRQQNTKFAFVQPSAHIITLNFFTNGTNQFRITIFKIPATIIQGDIIVTQSFPVDNSNLIRELLQFLNVIEPVTKKRFVANFIRVKKIIYNRTLHHIEHFCRNDPRTTKYIEKNFMLRTIFQNQPLYPRHKPVFIARVPPTIYLQTNSTFKHSQCS